MTSSIIIENATVYVGIPTEWEQLHDIKYSLASSGAGELRLSMFVDIPDVKIKMHDGTTLVIPRLRLRHLSGDIIPVLNKEFNTELFHREPVEEEPAVDEVVGQPVIKEDEPPNYKRRYYL